MEFTQLANSIFRARFFAVLTALWSLACSLFVDRFLPNWVAITMLISEHMFNTFQVDAFCKECATSNITRAFWTAISMSTLWTYLAWGTITYRLSTYRLLFSFCLKAVLTKLRYLRNDGPLNLTSLQWLLDRDSAIMYGLVLLTWTHSSSLWIFLLTGIKWTVLPVLGIRFSVWLRDRDSPWLKRAGRTILWPLVQLVGIIEESLHVYSFAMALLYYQLPRYIDHSVSRLRQIQRREHYIMRYRYHPLRPDQIRILHIQPRRWIVGGPIYASLQHVARSAATDYDAVSYHWGSSVLSEDILIDGHPLAITQSALDVLLASRTSWEVKTIWIDAICINQRDEIEKAAQVRQMRDIYSNASRVVAYPSFDWYARAAVPTLNRLSSQAQTLRGHPRMLHKLVVGQKRSRRWRAISQLFASEYFKRIWVVQEIAVGRDVQLYYGGYHLPWTMFFNTMLGITDPGSRDLLATGPSRDIQDWDDSTTFENIGTMHSLWMLNLYDQSKEILLETILLATSKFRATDPKDQIFAIIGISDCAGIERLQPDYGKSIESILTDVSAYLLTNREVPPVGLLTLGGIGHSVDRRSIPSWAIDRNEQRLSMILTDAWVDENTFCAAGDSTSLIARGQHSGSMVVQGIVLDDEIAEFSAAGIFNYGNIRSGQQVHNSKIVYYKKIFVQAALDLVGRTRGYVWTQDHPFDDDLWRTLIAGRIGRKLVTDQRYRAIAHFWFASLDLMLLDDWDPEPIFNQIMAIYGLSFEPEDTSSVLAYGSSYPEACFGRRFAVTRTGRQCLVPPLSNVGDVIFVPLGSQVPYLIRHNAESDAYQLVGEAYVQGIMMGEAIEAGADIIGVTLI